MKTWVKVLACCGTLAAAMPAQAAIDTSMTSVAITNLGAGIYGFSHGGWTNGGMVTGTFTAFDFDSNGQINFSLNEVTAFSLSFGGSLITPGFTLGYGDLTQLVYTLDGGTLGGTAVESPVHMAEAIWASGAWAQYAAGPGIFEVCNGTVNCAMINSHDTPQYGSASETVTEAVPESASWALLIAGFGLTGAAMRQRQRHRHYRAA